MAQVNQLFVEGFMDIDPLLKDACSSSLKFICDHLQDCPVFPQYNHCRFVLNVKDHLEIVEERFSQGRCGWPCCSNQVDISKFSSGGLRYDEYSGEFKDVSELAMFCCEDCFLRSKVYGSALDETPLFLRTEPVLLIQGVLKHMPKNVGDKVHALLEPVLPKIVEEGEKKKIKPEDTIPPVTDEYDDFFFDEEDSDTREVVKAPLIPLLWDVLGRWKTEETARFLNGRNVCDSAAIVRPKDERIVPDLNGNTVVQKQRNLSKLVGAQIKDLLYECDNEDVRLTIGAVDHLIITLNIREDENVIAKGKRNDYGSVSSVIHTNKGLKVLAAVFIGLIKPALFKSAKSEVKGVSDYEWDLLISAIKE